MDTGGFVCRWYRFWPAQARKGDGSRDFYALHLKEDSEVVQLRSRYALHKNNPLGELEHHLKRLSRQGVLRSSSIYLGTSTTHSSHLKGSLMLDEVSSDVPKYTPGLLTIQTRSPLIVIAMPVLTKLGKNVQ